MNENAPEAMLRGTFLSVAFRRDDGKFQLGPPAARAVMRAAIRALPVPPAPFGAVVPPGAVEQDEGGRLRAVVVMRRAMDAGRGHAFHLRPVRTRVVDREQGVPGGAMRLLAR